MKKIIDGDKDKLTKEMAKAEIYIRGLLKEQKSIVKVADSGISRAEEKLKLLTEKLKPYSEGSKEPDDNFYELKKIYEKCLKNKDSLQKAMQIASETIEEINLKYFQGSQDEIEKITI